MAGGPTTVALAATVSAAGGLGFLAAGYRSAEELAGDIRAIRSLTDRFGVNVFVPGGETIDLESVEKYRLELQPEADRYGVDLPPIRPTDDDQWHEKIDLLANDPVPYVSFTFGIPDAGTIGRLRKAGTRVLATVTSQFEAARAIEAGADVLVAQGGDAGGHSATPDPAGYDGGNSTLDLVRAVVAAHTVPVIAAGGVSDTASLRLILEAGANAAQIGTLLLRSHEAGTRPVHRAALTDPRFSQTVVTRAFTGRPARALRNRFTDAHSATASLGYPAIHYLTSPIRRAAAAAGDPDAVNLWAGVGFRSAVEAPAADIVARLADGV